jgi:hypothetical protein
MPNRESDNGLLTQPGEDWADCRVRRQAMASDTKQELLVEQKVTYTLFKDGKFYIIENVPARVNQDFS